MVHRALQINYRVDRLDAQAAYDQVRPGWLTQVTASLMANAIVDMHAKRAWQARKKNSYPIGIRWCEFYAWRAGRIPSTAPVAESYAISPQ